MAFALLPLTASAQVAPKGNALAVSFGVTFDEPRVEAPSTPIANTESLALAIAIGSQAAVANSTAIESDNLSGSNANAGASNTTNIALDLIATVLADEFVSEFHIDPVLPFVPNPSLIGLSR